MKRFYLLLAHLLSLCVLLFCRVAQGDDDPPQVAIGERLFLETRFAQFFEANSGGNANATLASGDPVMDVTLVAGTTSQVGPFKGQSMNCRACHLVDEQHDALGNRTYCDFAQRSPIPARAEDNHTLTPRNSPPLVNASLPRGFFLMHFDGLFASKRDLVIGTMTGRNYGWLPGEEVRAAAHIAHIIRDDDGTGDLAQSYGGAYRDVFAGKPNDSSFLLPKPYRLDVDKATDAQIMRAIGNLVAAYMQSLTFSKDDHGNYNGSPYDMFLKKNHLPRKPAPDESPVAYGRRLLHAVSRLQNPVFVTGSDGAFIDHAQAFIFGQTELDGLKIFLTGSGTKPLTQNAITQGGIGNCISCHAPPNFTDFKFHNTGATQEEYDSIHGAGAFAALQIPSYAERRANPDDYLPPSTKHPFAAGPFLQIPDAQHPGYVDLGLWNVFANPDQPLSQAAILRALTGGKPATFAQLLPRTIALFKTPGLRDLVDSQPYLHTGRMNTLEDVINFYRNSSDQARAGTLRNASPEIAGIALAPADVAPLAAFLRALTEDYN